jgi:hypothetical protein
MPRSVEAKKYICHAPGGNLKAGYSKAGCPELEQIEDGV